MSVAELLVQDRSSDPSHVGEIFAAWRVAPGALMLLGWQRDRPAPEGTAALQRASEQRNRFTRIAWPAGAGRTESYRFLAAVQLPSRVEAQDGDTLILTGRRGDADSVLARLPPFFLEPAAFGAELARAAPGEAAARVARFLMGVFTPPTTAANPAVREAVSSFLDRAAKPDGCVEIIGAIVDRCLYMQGWGRAADAGCAVILAGSTLQLHAARTASFARSDIAAAASGQALVLPAAAAQAGALDTVFLLDRDGIRRRPVLETHRSLSEQETVGHLRDVQPTLRCDQDTRAVIAAALRSRYLGRYTLDDAGHPVRLGIDLAMAAPGAGSYLTGWLYDPARAVASVHLCGTRGTSARLDESWTRIPREDVTDALRSDPTLPPGELGWHSHGFTVQAPLGTGPDGGELFYLDVGFRDGGCGFVPLALAPADGAAAQAKLLASVDLHKPSGSEAVERQLAPFLSRLAERAPSSARAKAPVPAPADWSDVIVVPLPAGEPPRALLSQFLGDPLARHEGILFACGEDWTNAGIAALERLARFYGLSCTTARVGGNATPGVALAVAAEISAAERFLLLSKDTVGRTKGWRGALGAIAREHGGVACVSPTVLYEDDSIRFAGFDGVEPLDMEPYVQLHRRQAGLPSNFAAPGPARETAGVSATCCLIPRQVLAMLGSDAAMTATPWAQEIDLLLRLRRAGASCLWAPAVQVCASEDAGSGTDMQERVGRLVAGWCLRARLAAEETR